MMPTPCLVGIVNLTTDSFYENSRCPTATHALQHALALHRAGANIIDLGPAASNPEAVIISSEQEIARLSPVVSALKTQGIALSIDSYQAATQRYGLQQQVSMLNDINGFSCADIYPELAASTCKLVVMHSIQRHSIARKTATNPKDIVAIITDFFHERIARLTRVGIARDRLILDPGMGFFLGTSPAVSITVLQHLSHLRQLFNLPLLISVSRKSFLRNLTRCNPQDAGFATLAAELYAVIRHGVDYIRTHDIAALQDALTIWQQLDATLQTS
ncbi:MAG: sulfonamide-resistant dihydropteroate synthase Sul2 [Gammaproteobacteria bacterium]